MHKKKKNVLNSPRLLEIKKKRQKVLRRRFTFITIAIVVAVVGLGFLFRMPELNIASVSVFGNKVVESAELESSIRETISGEYAWIVPKTSLLFLPKDRIKENLETQYPRLKDTAVKVGKDRTLSVEVAERTAVYTWCGEAWEADVPLEDIKCYFMDDDGFIFDEAPYFSGSVYFRFFGELDSDADPIGQFFEKAEFGEIEAFYRALSEMGLEITGVGMAEGAGAELYLASASSSTSKIFFNTNDDFVRLAENLQSALFTEPLEDLMAENYADLEYIDLRFDNRVYYKFK